MGALHRALRVLARDVKRGALVEHERDVGAEGGLDRHRALRREEPLAAVHVGAKANALLVDREDRAGTVAHRTPPPLDLVGHAPVPHGEDLEPTRVGDDRPLPAHEPVQAAHLGDQLGTRGEQQVKRIPENQLVAERGDVAGLERLDRALGRQWHERRRAHLAVGQVQRAATGAGIGIASLDREHANGRFSPKPGKNRPSAP